VDWEDFSLRLRVEVAPRVPRARRPNDEQGSGTVVVCIFHVKIPSMDALLVLKPPKILAPFLILTVKVSPAVIVRVNVPDEFKDKNSPPSKPDQIKLKPFKPKSSVVSVETGIS